MRDLEVDPRNVVRRAGLPEGIISDPSARLTPQSFYAFWSALEAETGHPDFALLFNESLRAEAFSPPVFAALCSPNLSVAVERLSTYKSLVAPLRIDIVDAADTVSFHPTWLGCDDDPPPSLVLSDLLFILKLGQVGTRTAMRALRVWTEAQVRSSAAVAEAFGVPLAQGTGHGITISRVDAEAPFLTANEAAWATFEPELRRQLEALDQSDSVSQRVRDVLLEALPSNTFSLPEVASRLAMSPRTLQRRLRQEGVPFKTVVDNTRHELALSYLRRKDLPPIEVAFLLGFAEVTSFYRAFNRWTGNTPEGYRRSSA